MGILVLADQYCLPRLVRLCELYITLAVDRAVSKNIKKAEVDVIGLLLTSQVMLHIMLYCYIIVYLIVCSIVNNYHHHQ